MWIEPKTDWQYQIVNGEYVGDKFNASDYNRIKNNLIHLKELNNKLYPETNLTVGADKNIGDYVYADEINMIEDLLDDYGKNGICDNFGYTAHFHDNGRFIDYRELNRIEKATKELYERMTNQLKGKQMLSRNLGIGGMF